MNYVKYWDEIHHLLHSPFPKLQALRLAIARPLASAQHIKFSRSFSFCEHLLSLRSRVYAPSRCALSIDSSIVSNESVFISLRANLFFVVRYQRPTAGMSAGVVLNGRRSVPSSIPRFFVSWKIFCGVNACFLQELDDVDRPVHCVEVVCRSGVVPVGCRL